MLTLYPYLHPDFHCWVFDDPRTGLKAEAFVSGMSEMIHRVVTAKAIPNAHQGFALSFSDQPFDGYDVKLTWTHQGFPAGLSCLEGNWYQGDVLGQAMSGWLCPALGLYFHAAPRELYVKAEPLPAGINPIWSPQGAPTRRFVSAGE